MQSLAEFHKNKITIKRSKDISRLYSNSHYGKIKEKDKLELNLLEGAYLLDEGKLRIFNKKKEMHFQDIVKIASSNITDFEIKYLVFKDLRNRGYPIRLSGEEEIATFYKFNKTRNNLSSDKQFFILTFSERDYLDIKKFILLFQEVKKKSGVLWFSIVDEEGDITYYEVSLFNIQGEVNENTFPKTTGILLKNRIIIFERNIAKILQKTEFFGKIFGDGLQLSLVESLYLSEKGMLNVETADGKKITKKSLKNYISKIQPELKSIFPVYKDLKKRGFIVKTGFKYGAHFRVYTKFIGEIHADYLVHVIDDNYKGTWADMSRAVRLAHSVNKEFVFAKIDDDSISYIKLGRLRP